MQEPANSVQQVRTWTRTKSNDDELNRLMVETLEQGLSQARGQAVRILQLRRQVLRTTTSFQTERLVGTYRFFRGFRWGSVLNISSGPPYNLTTGFDNDHDTEANDHPSWVTRNTGHSPAYADVDLRLSRVF